MKNTNNIEPNYNQEQ